MNLQQMNNLRMLRYLFKDSSESFIDSVIKKLSVVRDEIHKRTEDQLLEEKKKDSALKKALETLQSSNITPEDLIAYQERLSGKHANDGRKSVAPKYRYIDLKGVERTWSGRGKIPATLQEIISTKGISIDSFLIEGN
ncbi:MAG: H-NS histone family protein [Succinivibrio sp.]|nr:H-NS histone family protein [Succinivibrio sp.]